MTPYRVFIWENRVSPSVSVFLYKKPLSREKRELASNPVRPGTGRTEFTASPRRLDGALGQRCTYIRPALPSRENGPDPRRRGRNPAAAVSVSLAASKTTHFSLEFEGPRERR
jgi:hypothetical protein